MQKYLFPLLILVLVFSLSTSARAQDAPPAMDVQHFQPNADGQGWFTTHSATTLDLWQPAFGLWFSYARNPLAYYVGDEIQDRVVGDLATMDLQAAIGFGPADLAVDVPIHLAVVGDGLDSWGGNLKATTIGDIRLVPKVRFLDPGDEGFGLGMALPLSLPSGNQTQYVGLRTVSFSPTVILTGHVGKFRFGGNLGARLAGKEEVDDLVSGSAFLFRAAAGFTPVPELEVRAEFFGDIHSEPRNNPTEWLLGAAIRPIDGLGIMLAGGTSIGPGIGSPEGRLVLGVGYVPAKNKDSDGDGIPDNKDSCPEIAEDVDGFQDEDGCPDQDNDGDGIPDTTDACPDEAETFNKVDDEDGCPDTVGDTDGDGILDNVDKCPSDPEDVDQFEDEDGCPDPDNDQDQILDGVDKCPNEPEVYNNVDDEDGCPDEGRVKLDAAKKEIVILEKVYFSTNKAVIQKQSYPLLDDVAAILVRFPNITSIEVQGHTDKVGSDQYNMKLSTARANAVRAYLGAKGVAMDRLVAKGYGETVPLDTAENDTAYEKNRRVQFVILQQD